MRPLERPPRTPAAHCAPGAPTRAPRAPLTPPPPPPPPLPLQEVSGGANGPPSQRRASVTLSDDGSVSEGEDIAHFGAELLGTGAVGGLLGVIKRFAAEPAVVAKASTVLANIVEISGASASGHAALPAALPALAEVLGALAPVAPSNPHAAVALRATTLALKTIVATVGEAALPLCLPVLPVLVSVVKGNASDAELALEGMRAMTLVAQGSTSRAMDCVVRVWWGPGRAVWGCPPAFCP